MHDIFIVFVTKRHHTSLISFTWDKVLKEIQVQQSVKFCDVPIKGSPFITKAKLTILIDIYHINYIFLSYYKAEINQTRKYVCSQFNEFFQSKLF